MATDFGASTASRSGANARCGRGSGAAADSTISASAATGSPPRISSGLTSISAIRGWSAAIWATASMTATSCRAVDGRLAAERAQQRLAAEQIGELGDIALGARGNGEGDVPEHLGHRAAEAEGHDGAEGGVALHADHELAAAGDHLFDQHGLEGVAGALGERDVGVGDLSGGAQVEDDEPGLGLVLDQRAHRLHGDGDAERRRQVGGLGRGVDEAAGGDRDAVGGQDLLGGGFIERGPAGRERLLDDPGRPSERLVDLSWHRGSFRLHTSPER